MKRKVLLLLLSLALVLNFAPVGFRGFQIEKEEAHAVAVAPAAPYIFFTIASLMGFGIYATSQTDFDAQIQQAWSEFNDFAEEVYSIGPTSQAELMQSCIDPNTGQIVMGLLGSSVIPRLMSEFFDYMEYDTAADTGAFAGSGSNVSGELTIGDVTLYSYSDPMSVIGVPDPSGALAILQQNNMPYFAAFSADRTVSGNVQTTYRVFGSITYIDLRSPVDGTVRAAYKAVASSSNPTSWTYNSGIGNNDIPMYGFSSNLSINNTTYSSGSPVYINYNTSALINVKYNGTAIGTIQNGVYTPNASSPYPSSSLTAYQGGTGAGLLTDNPDVIGGIDESILPGNVDVYDGSGLDGAYDYQDILDFFGTAVVPGMDVWNLGQETLESIRLGLQSWTGTAQGLLSSILEGVLAIPQVLLEGISVITSPLTTAIEAIRDAVLDLVGANTAAGDLTDVPGVTTTGIAAGLDSIKTAIGHKFPFCIVYDLNTLVGAFVAQPVTPVFEYPLETPVGDFEIDIDLSDWDGVAGVVRSAFVVFAAFGLIGLSVRLWNIYKGVDAS